MPRPLWRGAISFGMVSIPVRLYTATEEKDVRFNMLHGADGSRIKQKVFCAEEDVEIGREETVRGYDLGGGRYVVVEEDDFANVPVTTTHAVEITDFVNLQDIDPICYQKTYYLEPDDVGMKPFALLVRTLQESGRVAVAKVTLRQKEQLATLRVYGGTLALETMFYADEVRSTEGLNVPGEDIQVSDRELAMAKLLVESMAGEFDHASYKDNYREALLEIIRKKGEGQVIEAPPPAAVQVTDLMEALRASVEAARQKKASAAAGASELAERRVRRRAG